MAKTKLLPFVVFYGGEDYLLDREYQKGKHWPGRNVTVLDGKDVTEEEVLAALEQSTMDDTEVAVVLDNAHKLKVGPGLKDYAQDKDPKDTFAVLVAVHRAASLPKGWDTITPKARTVEHRRYKPWEHDLIQKRVTKEADHCKVGLKQDAFEMLLRIYKDDTRGMANEIQKLSLIVPVGSDITKKHVLAVCRRQLAVQPWEVADFAANKSLHVALTYTALLFQYEGESVAVPIVASLMRQTERLLIARSMLDQGKRPEAIGTALNMSAYPLKKFLPVAEKHTTPGLLNQMKNLCKLETQVKGPAPSKRTLVELAVHQLAA